jgi:hypothetical protein
MSDVRSVVSTSPLPVSPWKFWAKPQLVPEPPIKVTGLAKWTLNETNVFAVVLIDPRSAVTSGPAALLKTGVAEELWVSQN